MESTRNINLIKSTTTEYPQLGRLSSLLTRLSIGSIVLLLVSGFTVSALFLFFESRIKDLTNQKEVLSAAIAQDSVKEGLLNSVKDRVAVIDKLSKEQKNVRSFFTILTQIFKTGQIVALSMDDLDNTVVNVHVDSIAEAAEIVDSLRKVVSATQARKPELVALTLGKDGGFLMSISYIPAI